MPDQPVMLATTRPLIAYPAMTWDRWEALDERLQELAKEWMRAHCVDPDEVPVPLTLEFDTDRQEWHIPVYLLSSEGRRYPDLVSGNQAAVGYLRRREVAPPPMFLIDPAAGTDGR